MNAALQNANGPAGGATPCQAGPIQSPEMDTNMNDGINSMGALPLEVVRDRLEAKIEELIALLDILDGDPDLEPYLAGFDGQLSTGADREGDDSDTEPNGDELDLNGDEADYSGYEGEFLGFMGHDFDGSGVEIAEEMIRDLRRNRRARQ